MTREERCDFSKRCLSKKAERKSLNIPVEGSPPTILQRMRDRIDTDEAKHEYSKRMGIVEPVFGNIRHNKKLNRFNYRTREKVNWQWLLFCLVHNIEKIGRYGKSYAQTPIWEVPGHAFFKISRVVAWQAPAALRLKVDLRKWWNGAGILGLHYRQHSHHGSG